ncbi:MULTISPECIES: hypothetical protein [Aeromicrobium]|uniref:Uncharacterized protein n=1 Tax=Aeromicrobium phoceense TaxID=2754045 RepID=A0A838XLV6_9ACTN|nr:MULTISPECIES: hypothetical protein [Aeromicrobium]MBA4607934.1 hypothetical protein [Aeromicrobium phoceense]
MSHADDRRPGEASTLHGLYELVPDAYELDLLEEARHQRHEDQVVALMTELSAAWDAAVAGLGYDEPEPQPLAEAAAPSVTQARFLVERLLGGVVVDDDLR